MQSTISLNFVRYYTYEMAENHGVFMKNCEILTPFFIKKIKHFLRFKIISCKW